MAQRRELDEGAKPAGREDVTEQTDPVAATIIEQGAVLAVGVGMLAFVAFYMFRIASLQHAMTLNIVPAPLP